MALKIRLRQQGRNNRPFYRVVVADVRSPRDGKYLESLGWYNPFETEADRILCTDAERIQYWISKGAEVSENVQSLIKRTAPSIMKAETQRVVQKKAKALNKRKARAAKSAK
jgi:small subunit ribosomal protein S16